MITRLSRLLNRLVAACVFSLVAIASAHAFEGKVTMTMSTGKDVLPITYYIKDTRMRYEITPATDKKGNKITMVGLADWNTHQMTLLMSEQKMYMVHSIPTTDTGKNGKQSFDFKPTGRKEKIAGYDTEEYAGTSEGKRIEMWLTKGLGSFMMANMGKGRKASQVAQWERFLREEGFFPMRTIIRSKEGAPEEMRTEVTSVEKGAQPDSLFAPPADFQKLEMPDLGGALKGLIPGAR